jgi:hypothetical protein
VGGGVCSREISHWMIGSIPIETKLKLLRFQSEEGGNATRTPYPPKRSRVSNDAG